MSDLQQNRTDLSPERRRLLELLLRQKAQSDPAQIFSLPRATGTNTFPLSFAQQRLWFIDQLQPGSSTYNIAVGMRLHGPLDVAALTRALNQLVERHETLRTTFILQDNQPVQAIAPQLAIALPLVDLHAETTPLPADESEAAALRAVAETADQPFDLQRGPLFRATLFRLAHHRHIVLLTIHHIIADGWSTGVLLREIAALYRSNVAGQPHSLPALTIQYADFAQWQRRWLAPESPRLEAQIDYWRDQLANVSKLLLPTDRPRTAQQKMTSARETRMLSPELTAALHTLSRHEGVTLFQTLLTAFQVLLYRYTGQSDIAVGSGIANRNRAEIEGLIGFFVNTLVLRADLAAREPSGCSFREALKRVRDMTLSAYAHQDLPFEKLVEEIQPERDLNTPPLYQVSFVLQNVPLPTLHLPPLTIEPLEFERSTAKLDLSMSILELPEGLRVRIQYNAELFESETITRMLEQFETLLTAIVADPAQRIDRLPLLPAAECQRLLHDWNATRQPFDPAPTLQQLVAAQVARTPDAIAVVSAEEQLTYRDLDQRANQLAHHLRTLGVGPESIVALLLPRCADFVVAALAALKADAAYLPLDAAYPPERLQFMLGDAGAAVLLTHTALAPLVPSFTGQLVALDSAAPLLAEQPITPLPTIATAEHLAYLIYTSGSTGMPKGVAVPHRGVTNLIAWYQQHYAPTPQDRVAFVCGLAFDASVWELWPTLAAGASLHLPPDTLRSAPEALIAWMQAQELTVAFLPTPLAEAILAEPAAATLPLRVMHTGGDQLHALALRDVPFALVNHYGPTENTVTTTYAVVAPDATTLPPIGRPIANTTVYLLDAQLQPVPRGVAGELYIGGAQLARGYHNRAALTAEKFVPDPFSSIPGSRLYRTGDLARYLPDGQIDFGGRIDHQVKLRGFRIELGEIEAALLRHGAVEQAVVTVHTDQSGGQRLIGYIAKRQAAPSDKTLRAELRSLLQSELPIYMVPATILVLDEMPLTPNGKIDRRALPVPDGNDAYREQRFVAPRTPTEELIANVWSQVLGVGSLSIHDNFFERGGHSLLATQAVTRLRNVLGLDLPLRLIFEAPTIAAFATQIIHQQPITAQPIVAVPRDGSPLPLSFAQQRLWFLDQLQRGSTTYSIPAVVRLSGKLDVPALARSLNLIVQRHEVLRTTFAAQGDKPVQLIAPKIELALPVIEIEDEAEIESLIYAEIQRPFDLREGPLLRVTLLRRSETEQILVFVIHHSVFDGWSQSVLLRELMAFYESITQQQPIAIAPLPIQYADYALWQRQWLQGIVLEQQLGYWRQQLADIEPLELPTDHPRPTPPSERGAHVAFELPDQMRVELQRLSQQTGATLFMTLLAAWQVLLSRSTRQSDIAVGTPIAGRVQPELEGLIGFFVNTLVLRTDLSGNPSFLELIERVRATALSAYAHQDLPFEMLVETIQPERDLNHHPLFQVMFALQNTPRTTIELPELTLEPLALERHTTKFDLTLTFNETADGLRGTIDYRSELFEAETIARMADQLQVLLAAIVADPSQSINQLPLLPAAERQRLLHDWNATRQPFDAAPTLQQLVAAQAARTPNALAVVSAEEQLTYRELDQRANQLAHHLRTLGVGPESIVALLLPRCADFVVAALAALKADAAYLPLDAAYPPERLQFMLGDAGAAVLLTHTAFAPLVPSFTGQLVALDTAGLLLTQQPTTPLPTIATAEHLAYIIYTSGSTGQPKGVAVPHRGVTNLVAWHRHTYTLTAQDRTALLAGLAFDAAVWELWPTLATGASLHLPPDALRSAPDALIEWMRAQQLTVAFLPTPLAEAVLAEPAAATLTLRTLLTGGDQLHAHDVSGLPFALVNHYGPTENSVVVTCAVVAPDATTLPPIGRPIANTTVYLLDAQLQPVPRGVAGELCIGGVQLARGYHNRAALTAEKFVPDPFSSIPGSRLYRTGDLARYLPDGQIDFGGRIDHQVKLRGFRIELGEIEAVLRQHPSVREAIVIVHAESSGTKRLVAYVTENKEPGAMPGALWAWRLANKEQKNQDPSTDSGSLFSVLCSSDLRAFVGERLPEYMVPSVIIPLEILPLTPNGKVDRRALPALDANRSEHEPTFVGPRTTTEELIARVWSAVLGVSPIGIHDNFFTLGGHSLLATQVITRLRQLLNLDLPLRLLFEAPTIAAFADRLASQQATELVPLRPIPRDGRPMPLSFAQQRMWFFDQLQPNSTLYSLPAALRIRGSLNQAALHQTLSTIIQRHEVLRTTFEYDPSTATPEPWQQIAPQPDLKLPVVQLPPNTDVDAMLRIVRDEAHRPFDLRRGPLIRAQLFQLHPEGTRDDAILVMVLHHSIFDGWSQSVMLRELTTLYESIVTDQPIELPALPLQYADYALWQRQWLEGPVLEQQIAYWREQLYPEDRPLPPIELPIDYARPPALSYEGSGVRLHIPADLTAELQRFSQQAGATLFMTVLAAFKALLYRYTGQADIAVGTPIAGRVRPELEDLIGCFTNTLVLRTDLRGNPSFAALVERVRATALSAYAHQDVPFEMLVERLQSERDPSRHPIYQVLFVYQNTPRSTIDLPGITLETLDTESYTAKLDLLITFSESPEGLNGFIGYRTDLFDPDTIERMAQQYRALLETVAANAECPIDRLPVLADWERQRLLSDWNHHRLPVPGERSAHALFEEQAARTPNAIAVQYEDGSLTYRELNERANQLAHHLRALGVDGDMRVGLCLERSPELIVGLLGILKAGAAYLPLDPTYPTERLAFLLDDAQAFAIVTQESLIAVLPSHQRPLVCLDRDWPAIAQHPTINLDINVQPDQLAYVIYTSGSTGTPKGVLLTHRSLVNYIYAARERYAITSADRVLQFASISFDASAEEIYSALSCGATLVLRTDEMLASPDTFLRQCEHWQISVLSLPTAFWHLLVDEVVATATSLPLCVRIMIIGGERADLERVIAWQERSGTSAMLINSYGPTESTIVATAYEVPPMLAATLPGVPIGQPLANLSAYILDARLQPVPIGGTGELYLGGNGLARGYLNRPALTAETFVPDPFSTTPGARLYRTGDLARYRADGQIDFVGRIDHQIKLRGFRVELGEIEAALRQHPGVREAVVEVIEQRGDKQIVAYVVGENLERRTQNLGVDADGSLFSVLCSPQELRAFLQSRLPAYMLPSTIIMLDALPLTASGKLDRKALPLPDTSRSDQGQGFVAPRTPTEDLIARVWETILGISPIGIYDNFFTLGGHSLLATQAITRLRQVLSLDLPLRLLFEAPTIATFAAQLTAQHTAQSLPLLSVLGDGRPLSYAQQRLWFLDQLQPGSAAYHLPTVVRLTGALDVAALAHSLRALVARHESLRTIFAQHDDQPIQQILPAAPVPLPVLDVPDPADHAALVQLVRAQVQPPFDLQRGPLLRAGLLRLAPDAHVLVLTLHHIVSDGWSQSVLLRELTTVYRGLVLHESVTLPELPIQYADYSVWQRQWLQGDVLHQQLSYWRQQLAGSQSLDLPTDRPRPPVASERGAALSFSIAPEVSARLVQLSQQLGATLFMTLLAAWQTLLYRYSGQSDIAVGTPIAGRVRPELERVVGFFVNTLVLRTDLAGQPSFAELVARVRTTALEAYAHQDLPFEMLVEAVQPARDLSRTPLFQVMFVLQNTPRVTIDLPDLTLEPFGVEHQTAKFDLSLSVSETPHGVRAALEYRTDLFDQPTIARMAEHLHTLLAAIVADPQQSIATLPLLPDVERQQLAAWNTLVPQALDERYVHTLFEAQVTRTPEAIAVRSGQAELSYRALNARANQVARQLRTLGVGPDTRVGVYLPRSLDLIVAILGTLKAGGAYVPLDPAYPPERLRFMLDDSQARVVLTQELYRDALPDVPGPVVCLDHAEPTIAQQPTTNPAYPLTSQDLAYVIYTSGSTGTPKGVAVAHAALVAHATTIQQTYGLRPTDRVLQFASPSFDVAIEQIVPPLLSGACVVLRAAELTSPSEFTQFVAATGLTVVNLPPVYWRAWVNGAAHEAQPVPPQLRLVLVGGEAMPAETVHRWQTSPLRSVRLLNAYGPTETIITATICELPTDAHEASRYHSIPIGRPLAHRTAYILDRHGARAPIGVPGELHLGGPLLARGYLDRPALTAEKFVPDPFAVTPGARLYRTGDLARYRADGQIEFLGRIDHQVKVRGFRIELGEIEAALRQHPAVQLAIAVVHEAETGEQLVAYVEPSPQNRELREPLPGALRQFVQGRLPEYMVPTAFVVMDELPLTPSGKLDRRALPAPTTYEETTRAFVAPRTPTEELIARVWETILGISPIGIYDNFFTLGGHSLLATQVISRLRQVLSLDLPLRLLFEAPTIAAFATQLDAQQAESIQSIVAALRDGQPIPLSYAQQRLWFLDQLQPGSAAYHLPTVVRLTGALDVAALAHSLHALVARHESLRTVFVQHDDQPIQQILPAAPVPLPVLDVPDPADHPALVQLVRAQVQPPFDLQRGPLLRAGLLRLAPDTHVLVLTLHHIVSDGWSQSVLLRELTTVYRGLVLNESVTLPELPIQYADYSVWQRQWLQGDVLAHQLDYWRQQLAGSQPLDLPTDRPRPPLTSERGGHLMFQLPATLRTGLNQLSQQLGATLFMTLLAAWQTLLYRYSGQSDIAVGTPIAGRVRPELERVIGFFVNTLVLRTDLTGVPSFAELVARVRTTALEAYAHQDLPFEMLVEAVQPVRDLSRTPLFQVMFVLQNTPRVTIDLPDLALEPFGVETTTTKFDLTLALGETPDGLIATLEYRADLFDQPTIARMAEHFQTLLTAIVADPAQSIATLPLLTDAERQQLAAWNITTADFPREHCLHHVIEEQVACTPEAIAIVHQHQHFSYAELNRRANQIAHELQARGVRPEVRVGICAEPSIEMIAGLLGILKAGGAYVPLDPAYPQERLAFMAQDSQLQLVLTQQHLSERLPRAIPQIICLDRDWPEIARQPIDNPISDVTSQNLAYLIYTSGSTGLPKGAMLAHQGVVNNLCWRQNAWPLDASDGMLQSYSVSFDPSVWNIFWPLMAGARLILLSAGEHADSSALVRLMQEQQVTVYGASPTLHAVLLDEPGFAQTKLRYVVSGGEPISAELQRRFFAQSSAIFCNAYGPTEATIDATYWLCPRVDDPQPAPIGHPLPNVQAYVLDRQLQPAPIGVPGEIYIGGVGLARGYQDRPSLTAERFVPNPYGEPGSRLYRTGDLARYRADGTLEFLGRIDHQVKLRGFRIELGEIEAALRQHPGVREAVVAVHSDSKGEKRLVAYVTKNGEQRTENQSPEPDSSRFSFLGSELRSFLREQLPEHMVPAAIMVLDVLPLTPSGKLDRCALPVPDAFAEAAHKFVAPRTPTEEVLANVWAAVLGRERIGIHDNFFTLGGHSLLATQAITRLRQVLSLDLPLRLLFEAPTIATFAAQLAAQHTDQSLPLLPVPRDGQPIPLSYAQQRLWFLDQLQPGSAAYHLPTVVRLTGALDVPALAHSLHALVARHESLRTVFVQHDDQPIQQILPAAPVPLPVLDVPDPVDHAALVQLVRAQVQPPFDLQRGPLLRASLLRLAPDAHLLTLTLHHSISDGWSQSVLLRELTTVYRGLVLHESVTLPELPIQYADYSVWQRQWLQGDVLAHQLDYWRQQLAGIQSLDLPTDHPRPPLTSERGAVLGFSIAPEVSAGLVQLSQQLGATLFMTLLAAWQTLLYRYSGQSDIAVGTPIAGRVRPELERVIGFFVNTLVLRTDLTGVPSFAELVARVRTTALGAYAHQDLPFEMLVEAVQPARDLSRSPLFQVMFALQNTPRVTIDLPDLALEPFGVEHQTAKFDLSLSVSETAHGLQAALEYRTDLFDQPTIARMAEHFQTLLAAIVADPQQSIADLAILSQPERQQLAAWNTLVPQALDERYVHTLFEAQVTRAPEAIAVRSGQAELSYRALNARANQVARQLRTLGVGPDTRVGVYLPRSLDLIVAILGTLKAGGAYVPLDPAYPPERLRFMLDDSQARVVLTQEPYRDALPHGTGPVVCLDRDWHRIAQQPTTNPAYPLTSQDLAYVIYTSGSTGTPKGVAVAHAALVAHTTTIQQAYGLRPTDRVLQFASPSFDVAIEQIVPPLLSGACVVLRAAEVTSPSEFTRFVAAAEVTVVNLPPVYWRAWVNGVAHEAQPVPPQLRLVLVGGEAMPAETVHRWQTSPLRSVRLLNAYGPTETIITATLCELPTDAHEASRYHSIPIGRPLAHRTAYILDRRGSRTPIGVPGELYLGGPLLARGYLDRPALTAERFLPDPFAAVPGSRLYRTGDLARYRADGQIEFLGRIDHQVKVRGFRIELGEIEAALRQHPAVQHALVVVHAAETGEQLVAYVEPSPQSHASMDHLPDVLHPWLHTQLPEYMIPAAFVVLDALPLTPSGKLDRRALPVPDAFTEAAHEFVAPRTPTEEVIANVWAAVLGRERIGIHDNFFALGGHSLLATQVISRLRQVLSLDLHLRLLFEAPTIAAFTAHLASQQATESVPLLPVPRDSGLLPLSFAQQRLWFLDQLQPGSALYTIPFAVRLIGQLDQRALQDSLSAIVARHEVLRTTFAYDPAASEPEPWQQIAPPSSVPLPVVTVPATADDSTIRALVLTELQRPFDLQHGPLLRAALFQRNPADHILALAIHHSVFDGWSQGVLLQELTTLYRDLVLGESQPEQIQLPSLPIQYADYSVWQRQWLAGDVLHQQLSYWGQQLHGLTTLDLPTDFPRTPALSDRGAVVAFGITPEVSSRLVQLSQRLGATLFMTTLAAWQTLLMRYTGQTDITVGTPIAGRVRPELENLIGCFINTLVLRSDLSLQPTFAELVARVRETTLGAYAHQDLPFEMLVEAVQPVRDLSRTPLFQVMFSLQNTPRVTIDLPDLTLEPLAVESTTAKFDLSLSLVETTHGLQGDIEYRTDLFEATTIARMAAHFQALLAAIVAQPEQPIDRLPLLAEAERRGLIDGWHDAHEIPADLCVHQLFEAHARRAPDAIAVQHKDRSLSYAALNAHANQFARRLLALGVQPEDRIGVCLPRSLDLVVALLGIVKAGAAYVPLDPAYPQERLQFMLDDAQIAVLVTQEALGATLPTFGGAILCVDRDKPEIAQQPTTSPETRVQPENLLYVIYTSGSTGTPKGVLLSHRSLLNYITAVRERYALTPNDRVLQFASISFDASVEELFVPLANGAAIVLRTDEMLDSPQTFAATCAQWQISVLSLPTAFWNVLVDASARDEFQLPPSVRLIIMGGEHAALERVQQWQSRYGSHVRLVNLYGPTETTIAATGYVVPSPLPAALPDTPIGQPLSNVRAYVLDPQMELLPIGVAGELYIGGEALARGYHRRPDLTAERFVPDPFSSAPAARLYKTGDRVRFQPDGTLLFVGRVDTQIKLRGYRIELGEIEAVLRRHPEVREAVVIVREDRSPAGGHPDQRLVAYVVGEQNLEPRTKNLDHEEIGSRTPGGHPVLGSTLRAFAQQHLPGYMVPSAIVVLDALPMTGSDKVDRRALPAPDEKALEVTAIVTPRNDEEAWLADLWAELLGRPAVSVTANFFELGGHSLLAVRLMSQIQQRSGLAIPLATLLQAPTIAQLAVHLRQQPTGDWSPLVTLQPQGDQRPLFLIHPIGGTVLCYAELGRLLGPDQPVYGLQARGVEAGQLPHRSMAALAAEYLAAIRSVQPHGPYRLGGWSFGGVVAFEIAQQLQQQGETIDLLALIDSGTPMPSQSLPEAATILDDFIQDLGGLFGTSLGISAADLAPLPADERLAFILQHARNQNVVPSEINLAQLHRLADLFHANLIALHGYAPTGTVEQIALLAAVGLNDQAQMLAASWQTWTAEVIAEEVPGTHYSLLRQPQVQVVADWLFSQLASVKQ